MGMLPFLLKEIAPIRIFGQELFTFVFLYRLFITYQIKIGIRRKEKQSST